MTNGRRMLPAASAQRTAGGSGRVSVSGGAEGVSVTARVVPRVRAEIAAKSA